MTWPEAADLLAHMKELPPAVFVLHGLAGVGKRAADPLHQLGGLPMKRGKVKRRN